MAAEDRARELTARGRSEVEKTALQIREILAGTSVKIVSSSFTRARQTAAIAANALGLDAIEEVDYLYPHSDPEQALAEMRLISGPLGLLVVSHNPLLSYLASTLGGGSVSLGTGRAAHLDCPQGFFPGFCKLAAVIGA